MTIDELLETLKKLNIILSGRELAAIWGMTEENVSRMKSGNKSIKVKYLEILEKKFDISLIKNTLAENLMRGYNNYTDLPVRGEVYASMGYGLNVYDETQTGTYTISNKLAKDLGINLKNSEIIFAKGDSMEPTIIGGDSLLVDLSKKEVYDGSIYCVRIDGQVYAKRLQKVPPDKIKVISDNKEKYDPFYVDFSKNINYDFEIIGEVRWWGRVAR